jgi:hypothetical protein
VADTVTIQARGLYLGASDPQKPDGAMDEATNVNISRDGIAETRRGLDIIGTKAVTRVWPYKDNLVGHGTTTLARSADGATWVDYSTALAAPSDVAVRAIEAQSCLFLTSAAGIVRVDSLTSEPVAAGVPEALDIGLTLSTPAGTAVPTANQIAYRMLFGRKDANGRLILGGPSSRGVIANTSGSTKDVIVAGTIPDGVTSTDYFAQYYRSKASGGATTEPSDEMGLVYESAIPAVKTASSLVRAASTVTGTTTTNHGYSAGMQVRISPGGTVASSAVAVGTSSAIQRSTNNGDTWSSAGISGLPAGSYRAICNGGGLYVAVGDSSVCATSADGLTWTTRTISSGSYKGICHTGTKYVAVGDSGAISYSSDGTTWASASTSTSYYWKAVKWNGSTLLAVGYSGNIPYATGATAWSSDGTSWTTSGIGGIAPFVSGAGASSINAVQGDPSTGRWIIVGNVSTARKACYSASTWSTTSFSTATGYSGTGAGSALTYDGTAVLAYDAAVYKSTDGGASYSAITWASGTLVGACFDGTKHIAVASSGTNAANGTVSPSSLTARTITSATYTAVAAGGAVDFPAGEYTLATASGTSFTYTQAGSAGTLTANQVVTPLSVAITDTTPDGFLGAALYTNANQEGILNANSRPLHAREIAQFRGSTFYAHVTTPAVSTIYLLGCAGTNGLALNDTITINGQVYTAKAAETSSAREFMLTTSGSAAVNIRETAGSLVRVLNRAPSSGVYAQDVSDPNGAPGQISIWCRDNATSLTVAVSRATAWSPSTGVTIAPKEWKNGLTWSKPDQPDHVPKSLALVPEQVGNAESKILRCVATRASLFIFKQDGLWRLTGDNGAWDIQPFDPTVRLVAPETAVTLDNSVFALCEAGVLKVTDTGVALMSRQPGACDIEPLIGGVLLPANQALTSASVFAIPYELDSKYILGVYGFGGGNQTIVYDALARTWVTWDRTPQHGCVMGGYLWLVGDGNSAAEVRKERKTGTASDLYEFQQTATVSSGGGTTSLVMVSTTGMVAGDLLNTFVIRSVDSVTGITLWEAGPANGSVSHYRAIPVRVTWTPRLGMSPGLLTKWQEVRILFDEIAFHAASVELANNYSATDTISLVGSEQGLGFAAPGENVGMRVWPSIDVSVGSALSVTFAHRQGAMPCAISGLAITHEPVSRRINR